MYVNHMSGARTNDTAPIARVTSRPCHRVRQLPTTASGTATSEANLTRATGNTSPACPRIVRPTAAAMSRCTLQASSSAMVGGQTSSAIPPPVHEPTASRSQHSWRTRHPHTTTGKGRSESGAKSWATGGG